ncbi:response regulator [Leptospira sp. GIMC2001]|uniref:response regulator n=1 Tax=Leptospira sp. GIMC2001 TaxID=1513297 RepID=UPI00234BF7D5|nr:response regulator [Leptospira sp. GIMC2001]WCL48525.1 response regulator [Leptospira sp. GIMC2001]
MGEILIIEDDPNMQSIVKLAVEDLDLHPTIVSTGEEGLSLLKKYFYDIVILDINLPGINGVNVLKLIRADAMMRRVSVIMLTVKRDKDTLLECARLGISDYIAKPFQLDKLIAKISMLWRGLSIQQEHEKKSGVSLVQMDRSIGYVIFTFIGNLRDHSITQFKNFYSKLFQLQSKQDTIILNFKSIPFIDKDQIRVIETLLKIIEPRIPVMIGGRNYSALLPMVRDVEKQLFIIEEDAIQFIQQRSSNQ